MASRKKTLTTNCPSCSCLEVDDYNNFVCWWGQGKVKKILLPHKGKRPLSCKLMERGGCE
jgi:hypothetical protein